MVKKHLSWVHDVLTTDERCRDSNELLYYKFLKETGYDTNKGVLQFLKDMEQRKIPYLDSIARASRKIQEECPHLRGKKWRERKKKEEVIREEIKSI